MIRPIYTRGCRLVLRIGLAALVAGVWLQMAAAQADPLPSWNDGAAKQAIAGFVGRVTREGSPDYIKPAERIATFDNDGTLWTEQPIYFQFALRSTR
jgi:hypothetical protein